MEPQSHGLRLGVEVDYCPFGAYWLPARVERATDSSVSLRFTIGAVDVTHALDLTKKAHRWRIAGIGMRSSPLLSGQPIDFLRRQNAAGVLGPSQQWQRCEVVTEHAGLAKCDGCYGGKSFGGSQRVLLRLLSSGSKLLGINYAAPSKHYNDEANVRDDDAVGIAESTIGEAIGADHVLCSPALCAPGGTFAQWVPSTFDIQPVAANELDENLIGLSKRARAAFAPAAETTARLNLGGRGALVDYDLVDILPQRRRLPERNNRRPEEVLADALGRAHNRTPGDSDVTYQLHVMHVPSADEEPSKLLEAATTHAPHLWFLGRVKSEVIPDLANPGKPRIVPFVYWFEPAVVGGDALTIVQLLRRAPVNAVHSIAPAGTYSIPWVVGSRLETRRIGGSWGISEVVSVDRYYLTVSIKRAAGEDDRNAFKPSELPNFGKGAAQLRCTRAKRPSTEGTGAAHLESYVVGVHHGVMSSDRKRAASIAQSRKLSTAALLNSVLEDFGPTELEELTDEGASDAKVEVDEDVIPHYMWRLQTSRLGHFSSTAPTATATKETPTSAPRKGTFFFRAAEKSSNTAASAVSLAVRDLQAGTITLPPTASAKLRRKSVVEEFFGR